jgi:hypothetical protein
MPDDGRKVSFLDTAKAASTYSHRVAVNSDSGLGIARTCMGRGQLLGNGRWYAASTFKAAAAGPPARLGVVDS